MTDVGFTLQPDANFLDFVEADVLPLADCFEFTPETLWYFRPRDGAPPRIEPNGSYDRPDPADARGMRSGRIATIGPLPTPRRPAGDVRRPRSFP